MRHDANERRGCLVPSQACAQVANGQSSGQLDDQFGTYARNAASLPRSRWAA